MWYSHEQAIGNLVSIFLSDSLLFLNMTISAIVGAPIVEEILFRGYLINKLSCFKEKFLKTGVLAVLSSIFLFAFIHLHTPIDKLVSGTAFTLVYVWGWRKNLAAAIAAHSAANGTTIFLGYIQAGPSDKMGEWQLKKNMGGKIFSPLTKERIERWIDEERVDKDYLVWRSGYAAWRKISEAEEFGHLFE